MCIKVLDPYTRLSAQAIRGVHGIILQGPVAQELISLSRFSLGEFVRANKQKANVIGW